jgi:hypothetical protein
MLGAVYRLQLSDQRACEDVEQKTEDIREIGEPCIMKSFIIFTLCQIIG